MFKTNEPAPTVTFLPILIPCLITEFAPIKEPDPTETFPHKVDPST